MPIPTFQEIHIENTNSCAYKCAMCPRDQHTRQIGYMSVEDFSLVLDRVGAFEGVFHLHGYGEPLLDRKLVEKAALLKKRCPDAVSLIFSTLGVRVQEDYFKRLIEAGLTCLVVSFYGFTQETYQTIHGFNGFELAKKNLQLLGDAMRGTSFRALIKIPSLQITSAIPIAAPPERKEFCDWASSMGFELGEWSYVHNYGDGRTYNKPDTYTVCPVVAGKRSKILNITWNLDVIPCCYDYNASIPFGNLRSESLEEIFSSSKYFQFLLAQQTNQLEAYPVCKNCEKTDYH